MTQTFAHDPSSSLKIVAEQVRDKAEAEVLRLLRDIRFGHLTIQIHDARIVQIERTTRLRFDANAPHTTT